MTIKQAIKFCKAKAKDLLMVAGYLEKCAGADKKFKQKVKYDFNENHLFSGRANPNGKTSGGFGKYKSATATLRFSRCYNGKC